MSAETDLSRFGEFAFGGSSFGGMEGIVARNIYITRGVHRYELPPEVGLFVYEHPATGEFAYMLPRVLGRFAYRTPDAKGEFIVYRDE